MNENSESIRDGAAGRNPWRWAWPLTHVLGLMAMLWIAWWSLAQVSFLYPLWHRVLEIEQHVERYGPQNRFKSGFESTSVEEHHRLFARIVEAIHAGGEGLDSLRYRSASGEDLGVLLREPEVVHLRDVARLVDLGRLAGLICLAGWAVLATLLWFYRVPAPRLRHQFALLAVVPVVATVGIVIAGPVKVFYALHVWIFPPGHQWFFYYQDSLMTTLMKAPDLFGGMALSWLLLSVALVALQWWAFSRVLAARQRRNGRENA